MQKIALNERSQDLIKNYLMGGAALGGSAALLTSLANYLKMLKEEKTDKEDTSQDDDTLYINMPQKAATNDPDHTGLIDYSAGGLAMGGGALAALGTYALVRKLYQDMKRKELQAQLDSAQQTFLDSAEEEGKQKQAADGKPMGIPEMLSGSPVAFTLLSALAAGALANMALNKTFPRVIQNTDKGPKKVVIRRKAPDLNEAPQLEQEEPEEEVLPEQEKYSNFDDGLELLLGLTMNSKSASQSELVDIVHAVAQGRHNEFVSNMLEYGFDTALSTVKGASETPISALDKQIAIGLCVKSAALQPVISLLAAAEYNDMAPRFTKIAGYQAAQDRDILIKIANVLGAIHRQSLFTNMPLEFVTSKKANNKMNIEEILHILSSRNEPQRDSDTAFDGSNDDLEETGDMNAEDSISSQEEKQINDLHPTKGLQRTPEIIDELSEDDDIIDEAMSHPITPANAVAAENK